MAAEATTKSILVVDDEDTIREVIRRYLERDGFAVREAADGYAALEAIQDGPPDLIVLDLMLPGVDGLSITQQIRERHRIPIIMLTAKGETSDRIRGLDLGADDYMSKPFSPQELVSRVKAVLRRSSEAAPLPGLPGQVLEFDGLRLDEASRTVTLDGRDIPLTTKEFDLLWFFARHPHQVFTRTQLLDHVWGYEFYGDPSTVTVHIRRLREKIERDPSQPRYVLTVWGIGYKFEG
ncbi:MAG: two component transcriptional regulator, winged helix family [Anaerolineales bacterium]|nr:two component transcriptional regulator, winged helix family [Anaerolineales bacterium]